jgi:8-oxo-dGTP pyrophosphatase MutT (NUDIX family)
LTRDLVARVAKNLVSHEPPATGSRFAAVSIIVRDPKSPSVLLIKRAKRKGDPWSGQIAFPGGKTQSGDATPRDTAIRETMEEVGIDLSRGAEFLGYGAAAKTHTGNMDVVPAVFMLREAADVRPNEEVASYRWVDLDDFLATKSQSTYQLSYDGKTFPMPAYAIGGYIVWGLTYRILSSVLEER